MANHWKEAKYKGAETLEGNYLNSEWKKRHLKFFQRSINNLFELPERKLNVVEIGCNLAGNLRMMCDNYDCDVTGFDINKEAIDKNKIHFPEGNFKECDMRTENPFKFTPDNYFDLGFSTGFLMHIPKGKEKTFIIKEFIRVCKRVLIYEMGKHETKTEYSTKDEWIVTYEDYCKYSKLIKRCEWSDEKITDLNLFYVNKE